MLRTNLVLQDLQNAFPCASGPFDPFCLHLGQLLRGALLHPGEMSPHPAVDFGNWSVDVQS